ncbi:MAG TPA: hypothetical protein VJO53_00225 [Candidatus Acidoferrales bacterium]|nr:hypothetical protein [Candidatus Acidoferrales bacterium]
MKAGIALAGLILAASSTVLAKDPPSYDKGVLQSMDTTSCGFAEKGGKSITGEILGTDGEHKNTQEVLCQEYVLQGDHIVYRIRPKDDKHPVLLPVGQAVQFRIHKDKMFLRDPEGDKKEREYDVLSMQMRPDVKEARNNQ